MGSQQFHFQTQYAISQKRSRNTASSCCLETVICVRDKGKPDSVYSADGFEQRANGKGPVYMCGVRLLPNVFDVSHQELRTGKYHHHDMIIRGTKVQEGSKPSDG